MNLLVTDRHGNERIISNEIINKKNTWIIEKDLYTDYIDDLKLDDFILNEEVLKLSKSRFKDLNEIKDFLDNQSHIDFLLSRINDIENDINRIKNDK